MVDISELDPDLLEKWLLSLSDDKILELAQKSGVRERLGKWKPSYGPQRAAFFSEADELFYGGQAGGGKTDLVAGLACTAHEKSLVLRRTNKEATKLVERFAEILGSRQGWNGQDNVWRLKDRTIDISGCQHEDDKQKFKGQPHDLIAFDEISDFNETQYRFIIGWNRSATVGQRCRIVATGNPPTTPEGLWVVKYWAPWVDEEHPKPAKDGELRWFTTIAGEDTEVDGPGPHEIHGEKVRAKSRTFIRARLQDNPFLAKTDYDARLAALPEELREAYREGKFTVSLRDDAYQIIPTSWIVAAQARWEQSGYQNTTMTSMALDPAGGGQDYEELVWRHGGWFAEPRSSQGEETADGSLAAAKIVLNRRHACPVVVDVGGGYGGAVCQRLADNAIKTVAFNGATKSSRSTRDGKLRFVNKRAEAWWSLREELDPSNEGGSVIALPPGAEIRADLAAPRWKLTQGGIQMESKDDLRKRLGRSPGKGDAIAMCAWHGQAVITRQLNRGASKPPKVVLGYGKNKRRRR